MPRKICPKCAKPSGPRTKLCPQCGYNFMASAVPTKNKPVKTKKKTGIGNRVSKRIVAKLKQQREGTSVECNWRELKCGDIIEVVGGGPFAVCKDKWGFHYTIPMAYEGRFKVDSLDNHGIHAFAEDGYHCYLYMGEEVDTLVGVLDAHSIRKIIPLDKN